MSASNARQGILSLAVKDKAALYSAYMPFVKNGGIFVPTPKRYFLGDEVFLLLTLPDSSERLPVAGKVIWVTRPARRATAPPASACSWPTVPKARACATRSRPCWPGLPARTSRPTRCEVAPGPFCRAEPCLAADPGNTREHECEKLLTASEKPL